MSDVPGLSADVVAAPGRAWTELARVETIVQLRHPVTMVFVGLGVVFALMFHLESSTDTDVWYPVLTGMPLVAVGSGMPIAGVLLGSRSRHDGTDELYESMPTSRGQRSAAHIGAFGSMGALTAVVVAVGWLATGAWDGLPVALDEDATRWVDYPQGVEFPATDVAPSLVELVQGPAALFLCGLLGLALGRWVSTRWVIVVMIPLVFAYWIVISWGFEGGARWFLPFADAGQYVGCVTVADEGCGISVVRGFDTTALAWHLLYIGGVAALVATALVRSVRRDRRAMAVAGFGFVAVVVGGVAQVMSAAGGLPS
ncbi:MAG TPA: hypothetical protein VGA13_06585 [Acidimicrobiales bacterium]